MAKNEEERQQIELFLRSEIEKWRQAFWISPLVEESEKIDFCIKAACPAAKSDAAVPAPKTESVIVLLAEYCSK